MRCTFVGKWLLLFSFWYQASECKYWIWDSYICMKHFLMVIPETSICQSICFSHSSFALSQLHIAVLLYGSEKWSLWLTFQPVGHRGTNEQSVSMGLIYFCLLSLLFFFCNALTQKADVSVEEISGCFQPRRTVWAHPPNPQSPWIYLQVHCSLPHALFPVSKFKKRKEKKRENTIFFQLIFMASMSKFVCAFSIMKTEMIEGAQNLVTAVKRYCNCVWQPWEKRLLITALMLLISIDGEVKQPNEI